MRPNRAQHLVAAVAAASALVVVTVAGAGSDRAATASERAAPAADPNIITADRLRTELSRTDVRIVYGDVTDTQPGVTTVAGLASDGPTSLAFEFQLFGRSEQATVRRLGKLSPAAVGWRRSRAAPHFDFRVRGVLANVAYAQYAASIPGDPRETRRTFLRRASAELRIVRALDDALFRSLPTTDPYAHPLLR